MFDPTALPSAVFIAGSVVVMDFAEDERRAARLAILTLRSVAV